MSKFSSCHRLWGPTHFWDLDLSSTPCSLLDLPPTEQLQPYPPRTLPWGPLAGGGSHVAEERGSALSWAKIR